MDSNSGVENHFKTLDLEMDKKDAEGLFRKEPYDTSTFPVVVLENGARSCRVEKSVNLPTFLKSLS